MSVTWLYTVIGKDDEAVTVRVPIHIGKTQHVIDWHKARPWDEPPITPTAPRDFKELEKHERSNGTQ